MHLGVDVFSGLGAVMCLQRNGGLFFGWPLLVLASVQKVDLATLLLAAGVEILVGSGTAVLDCYNCSKHSGILYLLKEQ
jgi:hypothetical protein